MDNQFAIPHSFCMFPVESKCCRPGCDNMTGSEVWIAHVNEGLRYCDKTDDENNMPCQDYAIECLRRHYYYERSLNLVPVLKLGGCDKVQFLRKSSGKMTEVGPHRPKSATWGANAPQHPGNVVEGDWNTSVEYKDEEGNLTGISKNVSTDYILDATESSIDALRAGVDQLKEMTLDEFIQFYQDTLSPMAREPGTWLKDFSKYFNEETKERMIDNLLQMIPQYEANKANLCPDGF